MHPICIPRLDGWQVAAHWQPARAVGGDFYDFYNFPDGRLGVSAGDVTDKGVPAALVMATTRSILRAASERHASPGKILAQANEMLKGGLAEEFTGKEFPRFCSPTLLVDKEKGAEIKTSKSKRMCVDYRKLNQRAQVHAGSLPNLEGAVEALCQFKWKA